MGGTEVVESSRENQQKKQWGALLKLYLGVVILIVQCVDLAKSVTHKNVEN